MVANSGNLWKHLRLLSSGVGRNSVKSEPFSVRSVVWRKKFHCNSRAFFVSQKVPTKNMLIPMHAISIKTGDVRQQNVTLFITCTRIELS